MRRVDPLLLAGLVLGGLLLLIAVYGDRIAPNEPVFLMVNGPAGSERPLPPGEPFVFGSDAVGRDLFSLVIVGARTTLAVVVLAGLARLLTGLGLAVAASWARPLRILTDAGADIASAVPSTIVAVFAVLVFARQGASPLVFVGALLVTGWAGPYRVFRAELSRLRAAPYTEGAFALGVSRRALLVRHHLPHLVPVLALSTSQQVAAALIALAELGVIGIFVGPTRVLNLSESMRVVAFGAATTFRVPDLPEWGGLLALGRGIQNLYVTRWAFLVPGIAIAFAAIAFTLLGVGIARQYRRRNLLEDLRSRRTVVIALTAVALIGPSFLLPPIHADAVELGNAARGANARGQRSRGGAGCGQSCRHARGPGDDALGGDRSGHPACRWTDRTARLRGGIGSRLLAAADRRVRRRHDRRAARLRRMGRGPRATSRGSRCRCSRPGTSGPPSRPGRTTTRRSTCGARSRSSFACRTSAPAGTSSRRRWWTTCWPRR